MTSRQNTFTLVAGLMAATLVAGVAAGLTAPFGTIRKAGPVEVRVKESLSGTEYYTTGHYATLPGALAAITDASDSKPYVIFLPPGVYDLGSSQISMKSDVSIVGSGQDVTTITCACGSANGPATDSSSATIEGHNIFGAHLRDLKVVNTGGGAYATGLRFDGDGSLLVTNVTVSASGGTTSNYGVYNFNVVGILEMTRVTASASGGDASYGVVNGNSSTPQMTDVTASASGATDNYGVYNYGGSALTMTHVTTSADGGTNSYGVYNTGSSPTMTHLTASATNATDYNTGAHNTTGSSPTMLHVTASGGGGAWNTGVRNFSNSSPSMTNVVASATGGQSTGVANQASSSPSMTNVTASGIGTGTTYGIFNEGSASPTMTNVVASATGGAFSARGVANRTSSSPIMINVTATATGATVNSAIWNDTSAAPTLDRVTASASGGTSSYGLYNQGTAGVVAVNQSQLTGATASIYNDTAYTLDIGASLLDGSIDNSGAGTLVCAESFQVDYSGGVPPYPYEALTAACASGGSLLPGGSLPPAPDGGEPAPPEPPPVGLPSPGE